MGVGRWATGACPIFGMRLGGAIMPFAHGQRREVLVVVYPGRPPAFLAPIALDVHKVPCLS